MNQSSHPTLTLPLERKLIEQSVSGIMFPNGDLTYLAKYVSIKKYLCDNYYQWIGYTNNSSRVLTDHGVKHIDTVIKHAGMLLGLNNSLSEYKLLPYETYVLLVAILIHDAGNLYGREGHEGQVFRILNDLGNGLIDRFEAKNISIVAEAHGGMRNNSKDTIGQHPFAISKDFGGVSYRPQLLAAILRFADEICEDRYRTSSALVEDESGILQESEVHHQYANSIDSVKYDYEGRSVRIEFKIPKEKTIRKYSLGLKNIYLIDFILERLDKMNMERLYCSRFMLEAVRVDLIHAHVEICSDSSLDTIEHETFQLRDEGYPNLQNSISTKYPEWSGVVLHNRLEKGFSNG